MRKAPDEFERELRKMSRQFRRFNRDMAKKVREALRGLRQICWVVK